MRCLTRRSAASTLPISPSSLFATSVRTAYGPQRPRWGTSNPNTASAASSTESSEPAAATTGQKHVPFQATVGTGQGRGRGVEGQELNSSPGATTPQEFSPPSRSNLASTVSGGSRNDWSGGQQHFQRNNSLPPVFRIVDSVMPSIGDSPQSVAQYLLELAWRSAYARENLRERVKAPAAETALRHLKDFVAMYEWSEAELRLMKEAHDVDRLEMLFPIFESWYLKSQAPSVVKMQEPQDWFPKARMLKRNIIFHCGPTNSGKTHVALEALMEAKSGVYCAPLKALASQVWKKVNARRPCDLLIGDERIFGGCAEHVSCTMEMTPVDLAVDVGVIDEIQLIEDPDRGWAWTRALLGLPAKELHICGEARALEVVKRILWKTKEAGRLTVKPHTRLVPLALSSSPSGRYENLENGDCVVVFSRKAIFETKHKIESYCPGANVNVIYGGLPFDVREAEAEAFNGGVVKEAENPSGQRHILVSTDAIAFGLNMNVRRIVLATLRKFDGRSMIDLPQSTILQICGRAGRYGLKFSNKGYATTFFQPDLDRISTAFETKLPSISRAGLLPTADILQVYASLHPELSNSFFKLMERFSSEAKSTDLFFLCDMGKSLLSLARKLDDIDIPLQDKIVFCFAPLNDSSDATTEIVRQWAIMHGKAVKELKEAASASQGTLEHLRDGQGVAADGAASTPNPSLLPSAYAPTDDGLNVATAKALEAAQFEPLKSTTHVELLIDLKYEGIVSSTSLHLNDRLMQLEGLFRLTEVYCWLAWRFGKTFIYLEKGKELKVRIVQAIQQTIQQLPRGNWRGGAGGNGTGVSSQGKGLTTPDASSSSSSAEPSIRFQAVKVLSDVVQ